jgi:hypothetical protein
MLLIQTRRPKNTPGYISMCLYLYLQRGLGEVGSEFNHWTPLAKSLALTPRNVTAVGLLIGIRFGTSADVKKQALRI